MGFTKNIDFATLRNKTKEKLTSLFQNKKLLWIALILYPAFVTWVVEMIHIQSVRRSLWWCLSHLPMLSITYLFYGLVLLLLFALIGSIPIATFITGFVRYFRFYDFLHQNADSW